MIFRRMNAADERGRTMTGTRRRLRWRVISASLALIAVLGSISVSAAAPTEEDVQNAKLGVAELERRLELAIEQYNDANVRLHEAEKRLAETRRILDDAEADATRARGRLEDRAVEAYTGMGSQVDVLLEAQNMSELSDRLQYMGAIAQSDADLATEADAAGQRAEWAAEQHASAVQDAEALVQQRSNNLDDIRRMLDEQRTLYEHTNEEYQQYMAAQEAALAAAEAAADDPAPAPPTGGDAPTPPPDVGVPPPPPNASAAQIAVNAALSVQGTQYAWGQADPSVGFDCSGLTSWAWAQAGVGLVHSSAGQYASLPHVSLSAIQPGDLLFFYSPISHVALYIGSGQMVHARHPGPGGGVQVTSLSAYDPAVAAARPG
jgi:cell wall-associated NlpC family hydrolase